MNPDQLAALEEERRFLLHSLDDLEREYEAGDVDDHDYEVLRDGYVSRAANVLRAIEEGREALSQQPPRRPARVAIVVVVVVVLAGLAGWGLARDSGQRLPGQTMTGGLPDDSTSALLSQARVVGSTDPFAALDLYDRVLARDPDNIEALTYRAWRLVSLSAAAEDPEVLDLVLRRATFDLDRSLELDPEYADARCFRAAITLLFDQDAETARPELERCLAGGPPASVQAMAEALLAQAAETTEPG